MLKKTIMIKKGVEYFFVSLREELKLRLYI